MYLIIHLPGTRDGEVVDTLHTIASWANGDASTAIVADDNSLKVGKHILPMEDIFEAAQQ